MPYGRLSAMRLGGLGILGAAAFTAASLVPVSHLIDASYVARYVAFAAALAGVGVLLGVAADRVVGGGRSLPLAALGLTSVLVPAFLWNRVGPIDVILIHVDTLRADHCSVYGYDRPTTPRLERFVDEGAVRFHSFIAQSAGTDKSTPAMLASIYPSMFYDPDADGSNFLVPDRFPLAGELLRPAGYISLGLSSNPVIGERFNYPRGFTSFEELWDDKLRPAALVAHTRARLEAAGSPIFTYLLILDPHSPYTPSEGFDVFGEPGGLTYSEIRERVDAGASLDGFVERALELYDGEIVEVDAALGELFDWLDAVGRAERTMVIVTSDHGEKFAEFGEWGHGGTLYESVIHVPLLWRFPSPLRFPALRPRVEDVEVVASHVDLLPTILGFLGEDVPQGLQGEDLTPRLFGLEPWGPRVAISEELGDGSVHRSYRTGEVKLLETRRPDGGWHRVVIELGPGGDADVREDAALRSELADRLKTLIEATSAHYRPKRAEGEMSESDTQLMRDLGYL